MTVELKELEKKEFDRLSELAEDLNSAWKILEALYPKWDKLKVADYKFRYLTDAQEAIGKADEKVRDFLGMY